MIITGFVLGLGAGISTVLAARKRKANKKRTKALRQTLEKRPYNKNEIDQQMQRIDRQIAVAGTSLTLTVLGSIVYPPLRLLAWSGLAYSSLHYFKAAYHSLIKQRKIKIAVVDGVMMAGILVTGDLLAGTLMATLLHSSRKILLKTEDRSLKSLSNIFGEQPRSVWVMRDEAEIELPFEQLKAGDIIAVNAGETIAADGSIISGDASIDEHSLTGESQPAEKTTGDSVFAATLVLSGKVHIRIEKAGADSVASQISTLLSDTSNFKQATEGRWIQFIDKSAPVTLASSAATLPVLGPASAVNMLFSFSYGYGMRIVAPATMLNYLKLSSQLGILIKDGRSLDLLDNVDMVVFDKTGTLTQEQPSVSRVHTFGAISDAAVLTCAAAAEYRQTHPVARAILQAAEERGLHLPDISAAHYEVGYGIKVNIDEQVILVGSARFMTLEGIELPDELTVTEQRTHEEGASLVMVAIDHQLAGAIELQAVIRPETHSIIQGLRQRDIDMCIISGDHEKPTRQLAQLLGINHYFAETLPENKAKLVAQLQDEGKTVCFVGDGINDSIALKTADVSVSMSGATSVATDAAQIVLLDGSLKQLVPLFDLGRDYHRNTNLSLSLTLIPTALSVGGILFFNISLVSSIILFYSGLAAGMGNAALPLLKHKKSQHSNH